MSDPAWRDTRCVELRWLRTAEGNEVTEEAITNPAHWAVWLDEEAAFVDRETGELVDEDSIDFHTEHHPDEQAEEGLRHFSTVIEKTVYTPSWYCIDHEGAGLDVDGFLKNARPVVHGEGQSTSTDEDQDEARARREAEAAEAAKRERRKVLALNKLGDAAIGVRREFVRKLLARPFPKARHHSSRTAWHATATCSPNTTATKSPPSCSASTRPRCTRRSAMPASSDNRALVIALGLVLGALEARPARTRGPTPHWSASPATTASTTGTVSSAVTTCDSSHRQGLHPSPGGGSYHRHPHRRQHLRHLLAKRESSPRRAIAQWAVGPVPRGPVPHPARGHPRTSNGAAAGGARPCRSAYGAAAQFAFLVLPV